MCVRVCCVLWAIPHIPRDRGSIIPPEDSVCKMLFTEALWKKSYNGEQPSRKGPQALKRAHQYKGILQIRLKVLVVSEGCDLEFAITIAPVRSI